MVLIDGTMFIALAQYLPETSATIIKFNVRDWSYEKLFCVQDHVGLVVPNPVEGELLLGTWGSRHYYRTDLKGNIKSKHPNPVLRRDGASRCSVDKRKHWIPSRTSGRDPTKPKSTEP